MNDHFSTLRHLGRLYHYSDAMRQRFAEAIRDAMGDGFRVSDCAYSANVDPRTIKRHLSNY